MRERLRVVVHGVVQGVGFRPFIYRLASDLGLDGWVRNVPQGVLIEVEGRRAALEAFRARLVTDAPSLAIVQGVESSWLDSAGVRGFQILESAAGGPVTTFVMPDIATCAQCREEIFDPGNRRHRYPFTNCTNCGPRFSLIEAMPYDRAATSMKRFRMCAECQAEYDDPLDRRFHAQPNACPSCGPRLSLRDRRGNVIATRDEAMRTAAMALLGGQIVATKGLGGFHLMVMAGDEDAVRRLRVRKHREEKPFAVMYPSLDLVKEHCAVSADEARLLVSPESPIVLLARRGVAGGAIAPAVAPGNPNLGVLLPYTPLHLLLLRDLAAPVIATSGNLSDEPICIDEADALRRLGGIADLFLVHDRPIVRHVDDSIVRVILGREMVLRRARGYAPLPLPLRQDVAPILAVGGHLKNSIALATRSSVFVSQHIGDLETTGASEAFVNAIVDLESLLGVTPACAVADLHPDYRSTRHAATLGLPVTQVQHHYAHVAACMAENDLEGVVLGVAWDGTGYGTDGTVWGGEFLTTTDHGFVRSACLRPFRLPGGERAIREPRRAALGVLHALADGRGSRTHVDSLRSFDARERALMREALARGVNSPVTTSAGRLFDAVASLVGLCQRSSFEGQAAMALEHAIDARTDEAYPFKLTDRTARFAMGPWQPPPWVLDWGPAIEAVLRDIDAQVPSGTIAARFHNTLAEMIVAVAERIAEPRVVLTGGCFQNRYLIERAVTRLGASGFRPYWHQRVPPNDGGIALGQVAACARALGQARDAAGADEPHGSLVAS
jgi:hydrogenase maturation protein HypF